MTGMEMIKRKKNKKGFTLVELVVVIAILGVLAAIAIPAVVGIIKSGSESADDANAHAIDEACKTYYSGVRLGLINKNTKEHSTQANLPSANANHKARQLAANNATVLNACEYAKIEDIVANLADGDKTFGYVEGGTIKRFEEGMTPLTKDTTMYDLYQQT